MHHIYAVVGAHVLVFFKDRIELQTIRPDERPVYISVQTHGAVDRGVLFQVSEAIPFECLELRSIGHTSEVSTFGNAVCFGCFPALAVFWIETKADRAFIVQQTPIWASVRTGKSVLYDTKGTRVRNRLVGMAVVALT